MHERLVAILAVASGALGCSTTRPAIPDAGPADAPGGKDACAAGSVYLSSLDVEATGHSSSVLVPAFSPDVYDYYVQCQAGANELSVSMKASVCAKGSASASVSVETPAPTGGQLKRVGSTVPEQTLSLVVDEGQAIVATAIDGKASQEYWVRCLPHEFSPMLWTTHAEGGTRTPGYYLVGNQTPPPEGVAYATVLDTNGVPVWYSRQPQTSPLESNTGAFDVDSVVDGSVSFISWPSKAATSPVEIRRFSPNETVKISATGWSLDPHEMRSLPNGDFLIFSDQIQTGVDLTGYDVPEQDGGIDAFGPNSSILPCDILEVDTSGKLVWKWIGTEHLDPVQDNLARGLEEAPDGVRIPDPFHCNSIDVDPANGNLLVSSAHMSSIFYIDRSTSAIVWKMGGVKYTKDGATYIPVDDAFTLQHDARLQPGWSTCGGQISLFDDESFTDNPARAVLYDVVLGAAGGKTKCGAAGATVAWQMSGTTASRSMGDFRIMSDGSRMIGWGSGGEIGLIFTEVDVEHHDLLDFRFTNGSSSYRSIKIPLSGLDLRLLRNTSGQ
jgi:hypothetical protein